MEGILAPLSEVPDLSDVEDQDDRIRAMVDWFHENFEDPAQETPYEGREGGYQYIWGGPFDLWEELGEAFGDQLPVEEIEVAANVLSGTAFEWAPAGHRILHEEEPEDPQQDLDQRLDALGGQLERVEQVVEHLRDMLTAQLSAPGMGHNRPPAGNDLPSDIELLDVKASIGDVRDALASRRAGDAVDLPALQKAEGRFSWLLGKLKALSVMAAAGLFTGVCAVIGKTVFETLGGVELVSDVTTTLAMWIQTLRWPF